MNVEAILVMCSIVVFGWLGSKTTILGYTYRILLIVILSAVSAYTSPVAYDHDNYAIVYNNASTANFTIYTQSFVDHFEIGYLTLNWLIARLGVSEAMYFFIVSLFINGTIVSLVYKYKNSPFILMWVYLGASILIMQQNLIRQFIAASVFLQALYFMNKGQWIKYSILVLLSSLIHTSAIINLVFVPFYFLIKKNKEEVFKNILVALYVASLVSIVMPQILSIGLIGRLEYYEAYLAINDDSAGMTVIYTFLLLYNFLAIYALLHVKIKNWEIILCVIAMAVVYNISLSIPNLLRLIYYYFVPVNVYLFHSVVASENSKRVRLKKTENLILVVAMLYFVWNITINFVINKGLLFSNTYRLSDFF